MTKIIVISEDELKELLNEALLPLLKEIEKLKEMLRPQATTFDDYEPGFKVAMEVTGRAKSTIAKMVREFQIPSVKKGGKRYFSRTELQIWLASGRRKILTEMV